MGGRKWTEEEKRQIGERRKGQKHSEETKRKMSFIKMGEKNPFYGKNHTQKSKIQLSRAIIGKKRSGEFCKKMSMVATQIWQKRKNSPNWQTSPASPIDEIRKSFIYRQWRSDIYTRDDFTCQQCGQRGGKLHAHHITPFSDIIMFNDITTLEQALSCDELWNINNGITYCIYCHKEKHRELAILST